MYYYVYYSYESWGKGYIGRRQCKCHPEQDSNYFGSYRDKTFSPDQKIILATFDSLEQAISAEVSLHNFFEVDYNPHFANRSKQTSEKFSYCQSGTEAVLYGKTGPLHPCWGRSRTEEEKSKISKSKTGKPRPDMAGDNHPLRNPEIVKKVSGENSVLYGKRGTDHPCGGTTWFVNSNGKCVRRRESPGDGWQPGRQWTQGSSNTVA
jgi:hypothetical protein